MQQGGAILLGIHPDLSQARADFLGDCLGGVGLNDAAIAAHEIDDEQVGDCCAVRNTSTLYPGCPSPGELPAKFGKEPRLADARLADDADGLSVAVFDLP